jgi:hypothetical protein
MFHRQNAREDNTVKLANPSFENMSEHKYFTLEK